MKQCASQKMRQPILYTPNSCSVGIAATPAWTTQFQFQAPVYLKPCLSKITLVMWFYVALYEFLCSFISHFGLVKWSFPSWYKRDAIGANHDRKWLVLFTLHPVCRRSARPIKMHFQYANVAACVNLNELSLKIGFVQ